jgi:predicted ATP-binding protein involved in virulence
LERFFGGLGGLPYLRFDRVGRDFEVWFRTPTGPSRVEDLAAGVQSLLAIIADLIIHLDAAYPDSSDSLKEPALVFIDELELHLHPAWQQSAAQVLLELFPGSRFIISTHSPLVVNDCGARSVLLFHFTDDDHVQVSPYTAT